MKTREQRVAQLEAVETRLSIVVWSALRRYVDAVRVALVEESTLTAAAGSGADSEAGGILPDPSVANRLGGFWLDLVNGRVAPALAAIVRGVIAEELAGTGIPIDSERDWQERFIAELPNRVSGVPDDVFRALQRDLADGIAAGDGAANLRDRMAATLSTRLGGGVNDWHDKAMLIARTEANRAVNGGLQRAWTQRNSVAGISTYKQWIATLDGRTRPTHIDADGQTVPVDGYFTVGGSQMSFPGDPAGGPGETANCRCVMGETETPDTVSVDDPQMAGGDYGPIPGDGSGDPTNPGSDAGLTSSAAAAVGDDHEGNTMPAQKAQTWSGLLAPIGVNSGDRRRLATGGTFSHRDLPLPLMFQDKTGGGHDNSVVVGRILTCTITDDGIYGTGDYLVGEEFAADVAKAVNLAKLGLGHVSVDLADVTGEMVDAQGNPIAEEDLMRAWEAGEDIEVYDQFTVAKLIGCTQVAKPAFAEAIISLDGSDPVERTPDAAQDERDQRQALAELAENGLVDTAGTKIDVGDTVTADPDMKSADDDEDGDSDAVSGTVTALDVAKDEVTVQPDDSDQQALVVPSAAITVTAKAGAGDDDDTDPSGDGTPGYAAEEVTAAVEAAVAVEVVEAAGEGDAPATEVLAAVEEILEAALEVVHADAVVASAEELLAESTAQLDSLRAAAGPVGEWRPDPEAFANPQLSQLTPMTVGPVQADGTRRVFGHVAGWKTCHIAYSSSCVTPPREDDFGYFHIGEVTLADGSDLAVGNLTLGGRHAEPNAAYREATAHYDDSGAGVAVVRAYADEFGIAVAGVITPETTEAQLGQLRRSALSGDWRRIGGRMRMVGALAVNTGGFPVPRYQLDEAGRVMSLVAAGAVPQALRVEETYEDVARRVFADERAKERRREEVLALCASADEIANRTALEDLLAEVEL